MEITVTVNGTEHTHDVEPRLLLADHIATAKYHLTREGADYYFCSPGCLETFRAG